jgi:hypothetical protein
MDTSIITTIFNEIGTEFQRYESGFLDVSFCTKTNSYFSSNLSVWIMTSYMLSTSALQPLCKFFSLMIYECI